VPHPVVPASESDDGNMLCPCQLMIAVVLAMVRVVLLPCLLVRCFDGTLGFLAVEISCYSSSKNHFSNSREKYSQRVKKALVVQIIIMQFIYM
jgi:hypothetical protein